MLHYYHYTQALQERQDLKHKGDQLDAEVRRAEEELRALENTVVVMNSLNEVARGNLHQVCTPKLSCWNFD